MCTVKDCESPARHEAADCFAHGGGKQGQYPDWYRGPRDIHLPKHQREPRKTKPRTLQSATTIVSNASYPSTASYPLIQIPAESRAVFSPPSDSTDEESSGNRIRENNTWLAIV